MPGGQGIPSPEYATELPAMLLQLVTAGCGSGRDASPFSQGET